jgi:hypothetical protein
VLLQERCDKQADTLFSRTTTDTELYNYGKMLFKAKTLWKLSKEQTGAWENSLWFADFCLLREKWRKYESVHKQVMFRVLTDLILKFCWNLNLPVDVTPNTFVQKLIIHRSEINYPSDDRLILELQGEIFQICKLHSHKSRQTRYNK